MIYKISALAAAVMTLSACSIDPSDYETDPVQVESAKGSVTCQLYTKRIVRWDRAIDRPATMSVKEADDICLAEGLRTRDEG
ncbi:hypothetical protein PE067_21270 [Paracoccus sp. DMF-8]|uniref:hypothetical protein n=1 Tax=Paracoccus sp. DMF-8 TaxID=3019445 RepID=UPI0023E4642E|nr:hypothetical protein [Paracoccus sp. DMF-8]MDF3608449.1 hypothetical protein [Paracoccus sp. DMF-8]